MGRRGNGVCSPIPCGLAFSSSSSSFVVVVVVALGGRGESWDGTRAFFSFFFSTVWSVSPSAARVMRRQRSRRWAKNAMVFSNTSGTAGGEKRERGKRWSGGSGERRGGDEKGAHEGDRASEEGTRREEVLSEAEAVVVARETREALHLASSSPPPPSLSSSTGRDAKVPPPLSRLRFSVSSFERGVGQQE